MQAENWTSGSRSSIKAYAKAFFVVSRIWLVYCSFTSFVDCNKDGELLALYHRHVLAQTLAYLYRAICDPVALFHAARSSVSNPAALVLLHWILVSP